MPMPKKVFYVGAVIVAVAAVGAAVASMAPGIVAPREEAKREAKAGDDHGGLKLSPQEIERAGIQVERVERADYAIAVQAIGTVAPDRNRFARVTVPVAGRVLKVAVDLGAEVKAGDVLATLESPELAEARTLNQQNRTERDLAQLNYDRSEKLVVDGGIAQKDLLRARSDLERAKAALLASEAKLATLGASVNAADGASSATLAVIAPLSGTVVERTAVLGEYAQAYQALFTVADLSKVWVETNLYDRDLGTVGVGSPAKVAVAAFPGRFFSGQVTYVGYIIDKDTRTAVARVEVPNLENQLRPGMFANVEIDTKSRRSAVRVPENAVVLLQGQMTAFIADDDGFEARPVELGERQGGMVAITFGIEPGDKVVTSGVFALKARLLKSQIGDSH